jgi:phosphoribosyl 1,2-cyclic phosphate phosphodiesterase
MENKVTILGSGTSTGVPILGCSCKICQSSSVKNKRCRTSILITSSPKNKTSKKILIDTTPDLRTQLLRENISHIDAAVITHEHADHTHGIDDLRAFCFWRKDEFPIYTSRTCLDELERKFPYIFKRKEHFKGKKILGGGIPMLKSHVVELNTQTKIEGLNFDFFKLPHGHIPNMGFICEKMGYVIDCKSIPAGVISKLKRANLDLLILDLNSIKPHSTHLHLDLSVEYAKEIGAKTTRFIHLNHDHDHESLCKRLESLGLKNTYPCFDGEILSF